MRTKKGPTVISKAASAFKGKGAKSSSAAKSVPTNPHYKLLSAGPFDPRSPTLCATRILRGSTWTDDGTLGDAFFRAGDAIVHHLRCGKSLGHAEYLFAPVGFLMRHAVELMLKHTTEMACRAELLR